MRNIFVVLSLICCLNPCLTWAADNKPLENTEFQVFKAQTELKLDTLKENQVKAISEVTKSYAEDLNKLSSIISAQDKRIGDLNLYLAIYAVIGGVLGILVAVAAYLSAGSKAREEARKESKECAETWFNKNENGLLARLKALEDGVTDHANNTKQSMTANADEVKADKEKIQQALYSGGKVDSPEGNSQLKIATEEITHKPSAQFTYVDWDTLAFNEISENNHALAADYWGKAADTRGATDYEVATALFNKGVAFGKINQPDNAITIYEELISRFKKSTSPEIQEHIARALVNKGAIYLKIHENQKAIETYEIVLDSFGASKLPAVQMQVGFAASCKGFLLLLQAKQEWTNATRRESLLNEALSFHLVAETKEYANQQNKAIVLANLAYTLWLLNRNQDAIQTLGRALLISGDTVRDDAIADAAMHTVDADAGFVALVNKLWAELPSKVEVDK